MEFHEPFRAMDTEIDLLVQSAGPALDAAVSLRLLFEQQEERFSRFRRSSLLSRLNNGETIDDPLFATGCRLALEAHRFTGGLYNPMILPALRKAGYDKTFSAIRGGEPEPGPAPDPAKCLVVDDDRVSLREGAVDLGGLVKGWTVDLGIALLSPRYPDVFINAGGDLRCAGEEPGHDGWLCAIDRPGSDEPAWEGAVRGAIATSTTLKRRWRTNAGGVAHHIIDPRTGLPAGSPFEQVTVWAAETWRAECRAKAIVVGGETAAEATAAAGCRVLAIDGEGGVREWAPASA